MSRLVRFVKGVAAWLEEQLWPMRDRVDIVPARITVFTTDGSRASLSAIAERDVLTPQAPAYAHRLRQSIITLGVFVALVVGLLASVPGLNGVTRPLSRISPGWIGLAVALEVLSGAGYMIAFQLVFARVPHG